MGLKKGWRQIGVCGVDSGQLLITDPCYIDSQWEREAFVPGSVPKYPFSYNACAQVTLAKDGGQLMFKMGHPGVGVTFSSGIGDGVYPVYALVEEVPGWGKRIVEVKIVMR